MYVLEVFDISMQKSFKVEVQAAFYISGSPPLVHTQENKHRKLKFIKSVLNSGWAPTSYKF